RNWMVDLKADPHDEPIPGKFELIGNVIDPAQRTGLLLGWVNNADGRLLVGQFITATIELPPNPGLVAVPEKAVIEEGSASMVFVEADGAAREFVRRKVAVIRRGHNLVFISSQPGSHLASTGCE